MAITETKIIQVDNNPSIINASNEEWGMFGWSVLSVEITHSENTKTYTPYYGADHNVVETSTINYATITYQRDKQMPNYTKIAALEREFTALREELEKMQNKRYSLIPYAGLELKDYIIIAALSITFITLPLAIIYYFSVKKKKKQAAEAGKNNPDIKKCDHRIEEIKKRLEEIPPEAASLMNIA